MQRRVSLIYSSVMKVPASYVEAKRTPLSSLDTKLRMICLMESVLSTVDTPKREANMLETVLFPVPKDYMLFTITRSSSE